MRHFLISLAALTTAVLMFFLSSCSVGEGTREEELKDTLSTTHKEMTSIFSEQEGEYSLVSEYVYSWAKNNQLKVAENADDHLVIINPATKGFEKKDTVVLQCAIMTDDIKDSLPTLAVALTSVLGPEEHGKITLIVTETDAGFYSGARSVDPKYYDCDNFINMAYGSEVQLLTKGANHFTGTMTTGLKYEKPSYKEAYTITMSIPKHVDPYNMDKKYPNPVETVGNLLATSQSSGYLFEIASFNSEQNKGCLPNSATAEIVIDSNNVEKFTKKFDKSHEKIDKKFDKLEDNFVYTMTETSMPDKVLTDDCCDRIISLMYTLPTDTYSKDEDTEETISVSNIASVSTDRNRFRLVVATRSLQKNNLEDISNAFATTSGLSDITYRSSERNRVWESDPDSMLADYFIGALGVEDADDEVLLDSSECDIFASRNPGLNIISFKFTLDNHVSAMLNTVHFMEKICGDTEGGDNDEEDED